MGYPERVSTSRPSLDESAPACCASPVDPRIARRFDEKSSAWVEADDFPEMVDVSAGLLDLLRDAPTRRPSVLELGCGTGGLGVALLEMGASRVTGIDLSAASVDVARRRAVAAGYAAQATFRVGNAADGGFQRHDWVVLDRVICCFGDAERLVRTAVDAANERISISLPESRGWRGLVNRPLWAAESVWDMLRGGCRGYVHDLRRIEAWLAAAGFRPSESRHAGLWHLGTYDRS